jgi:hypothetical protein
LNKSFKEKIHVDINNQANMNASLNSIASIKTPSIASAVLVNGTVNFPVHARVDGRNNDRLGLKINYTSIFGSSSRPN